MGTRMDDEVGDVYTSSRSCRSRELVAGDENGAASAAADDADDDVAMR